MEQLDIELTEGYFQQEGATCYTSKVSMRLITSNFGDRVISKKNLWPPNHLTSQLQVSSCRATFRTEHRRIYLGHLLNSVRQLRMKSATLTRRHFGKHRRIGCDDTVMPGCWMITFSTYALRNLPKFLCNSGHIARIYYWFRTGVANPEQTTRHLRYR